MDWLLVVLGSCIVMGNVTRSFMMTSQPSSAGVAWRNFCWLKMSSEEEESSLNHLRRWLRTASTAKHECHKGSEQPNWLAVWQNEDSLPAAFFYTKRAGFLYQNEISSVVYGFRGGWSWPALPCGLYKPVISTSQGCISDVFAVPKCPQRNMWWIYGHLRAQIEILPSYLHRPGADQ